MPEPTLADGEGRPVREGSVVAFYFSDAAVRRGTVAQIKQTLYEQRHRPDQGTLYITLEEGGTRYKRRSDQVLVL